MSKAFAKGVFASIDLNYRTNIWGSGDVALRAMDKYFKVLHMITMGRDELANIFGVLE